MAKAHKKPSLDKHADNLLQAIDKEWNQDVKHNELVLGFTVGAKRERGLPPCQLQLVEATPPPPSSGKTGGNSFLDPKPCSYLDCSGLKFGTSTDSTFTSLVILNRYLEKVKFVKVLLFVPYNKLMTPPESDTDRNWSSTIFSCPAIHLLNEMPQLKISFGLVVVQYIEGKPSGKKYPELRNAFLDQIKAIRDKLLVEDPPPELQLHLNFLRLIIRRDINFLILQQQHKYRWDGTVKSLVNLKTPPGFNIIKFHQKYLRVTNKITGKYFLTVLTKVHDGQHFTAISSRLHNHLSYIINQLIASTLDSVFKQYSTEVRAQPKRKDHGIELISRFDKAIEFCKHRISSDSFVEFMEMISIVDYPLDIELYEKLSTYFVQLQFITEISNVLQIETEELKGQVDLKTECNKFLEKIRKKIVPKFAADLKNEREEICIILQSAYQAISQSLIDFYHSKILPENLFPEKSRKKEVELLCKAEELLEILESDTSSSFQITVYEKLSNWPGYELTFTDLLGDVENLKSLEDQHKNVEHALQLMEHQYISCGNHSGSSISRNLRDHLNEVKCNMIRCSEVVQVIEDELQTLFNHIIVTFEELQLRSGFDMESLPEKLKKITCLLGSLEERQNGNYFLTGGSLITEVDSISELFLNHHLGSQQKAVIQKELGNLETFMESIQQENRKTDLLNNLFATITRKYLMERLTGLEKLITILMDMKYELSSYNCQCNQEKFADQTLLYEGNLLRLIGEGQNSPPCLVHIEQQKRKTIQTNFPAACLSLAKEIAKFLNPGNTKVERIFNKILQIKGNLVKFSDFDFVDKYLHSNDLKEIHVFATKRIYVDANLRFRTGSELELTLISPSIEIIGNRVIALNGKHGENNLKLISATDGVDFGQDGENGLPGKAGANGGHLYLICEEIINAARLTVEVRGGNGSDGQRGGGGGSGAPGRNAEASELNDQLTEKQGDPGSPGGNGGDGGAGGYSGHGGSVEIVVLEKQDGNVEVSTEDGECGNDGSGGMGGEGGKHGNGIQRVKGWAWFGTKDKPINCDEKAPSGRPGRDGANSTNQELPSPKKSRPDSKETVISELRKFYVNQSNNGSLSETRQFLEKIDSKLEFEHVSVKSLAQDLLQLELTSRNVRDPDSMIRDHEIFQNRLQRSIPHLISSRQLSENQDDLEHVIKLLFAQSISKVLVLKEHHGQSTSSTSGAQVINLLGYFDIIKDTINRLKESSLEVNRREALKTYHDHLKAKCDDTKDFISRIVLPSTAQAKKEIQEEINCCAGEVECYGRMVEEDLRMKYIVASSRASSSVQFWDTVKTLLTFVEVGIEIAQIFSYSRFSVIGLVAIAGVKKWIGGDDDDQATEKQNIQLPACLNNFQGTMEDKVRRMRKEWELVTKFMEGHYGNDDDDGKNLFRKIEPSLETWQSQLIRFQKILNLMKEKKLALGEELDKVMTGMERSKTEILTYLHETLEVKPEKATKLSPELVESIKNLLVAMALTNCDSTRVICTPKRPSASPTEPIKIAQNQLQSIEQKYAAIVKDIMPLISAVVGNVTPQNTHEGENDASTSLRIFEKWRIQTTLRKLKENLAIFFNGLESKDRLIQAVQQMEEGLSLLIDLYDMMDGYEESKLFSSALAGIKLDRNNEDSVELQATVDKIGYLLKANTFILDYNQAVHAFKQWIFPFANKCPIPNLNFETDLTLDNVNCENHLDKLAAEYKSHFDLIHGHLLRYRSMQMDVDDVIFRGKFSSDSSACPPFYVWKGEEWGNTITRLLKGEEVELRADLLKEEEFTKRKMGAVKFKTVQLKIRAKNGIMSKKKEEELNKIMKLFKVTLIHSGISYYKVFDQCFVMRGSRNEYCYSFDGATKNSTYEKSKSQGDYLLSPFTIWKFQLNEIMHGGGAFEQLNEFEGQVDLELWGDGLYLDEGKAKDKKLDEKYLKNLHLHYELV